MENQDQDYLLDMLENFRKQALKIEDRSLQTTMMLLVGVASGLVFRARAAEAKLAAYERWTKEVDESFTKE